MPRPINPQTLQAIGGQQAAEAVQRFQQSMSNAYSVKADREQRVVQNEAHKKQMRLADLNIAAKEQQILGATALSVLEMIDSSENPATFSKQYETFRNNSTEEVKKGLPAEFKDIAQASMWAKQQAAQSNKLLPYLQLQRKGANISQWQAIATIMAVPPDERSAPQKEFLAYYAPRDTNIFVTNPTKPKMIDTINFLANVPIPGTDTAVLDALDKKSGKSFISALTNLSDGIVAGSRNSKDPIDRNRAHQMAFDTLSKQIVAKESLLQKYGSWVGVEFDSDYVFVQSERSFLKSFAPEDSAAKDMLTKEANPQQTRYSEEGYEIRKSNTDGLEYMWDMSFNPPKNMGAYK